MLILKLIHVSKRGHLSNFADSWHRQPAQVALPSELTKVSVTNKMWLMGIFSFDLILDERIKYCYFIRQIQFSK